MLHSQYRDDIVYVLQIHKNILLIQYRNPRKDDIQWFCHITVNPYFKQEGIDDLLCVNALQN